MTVSRRQTVQGTIPSPNAALPIHPDPLPTSAAEQSAVDRVQRCGSIAGVEALVANTKAPSPALLTAALAWMGAHANRMQFQDFDRAAPWMMALEKALGGATWTVTMNAWHARAAQSRRVRTPRALLQVARRWGQEAVRAADLTGYVGAAVADTNPVWAEQILRHAPQWSGAQVQRVMGRSETWRLWRVLDRNTQIPVAGWRAIEQHLAFRRPTKDLQGEWTLGLALPAMWRRVGASEETQARAVAILQRGTARQRQSYDLQNGGDLQSLVKGGFLPWARCAPWASAATSRGVIDILLEHPDLPAALAIQWMGDGENVHLLRHVARHPTLGQEPAIRAKLWPFIRHSTAIMAVFLRHGTVEEAVSAFDILAARAPRKALAALEQDHPPAGFATSSTTLRRLLAHRDAEVRTAAISAMHTLGVDDTVKRTPLPKHQRAAVRRSQT